MSKNYFKMFIIVLIFILAIGIVSAQDVSLDSDDAVSISEESHDDIQTQVTSESNNEPLELEVSDEDVLSQANFNSLKNNITSASVGGTVYINDDVTYDGSSDDNTGITISKSLTIDGQGNTISGNSKSTVFTITTPNKVTLQNIIFTDVGARSVINIGTSSSSSTFNVNIVNCTFYNPSELTSVPTASANAAVMSYSNVKLNIENSRFINGSGSTQGRGFYFDKTATVNITCSTVDSNYVVASEKDNYLSSGGAMYFRTASTISIASSIFRNNHVSCTATYVPPLNYIGTARGGAIYFNNNANISVINSTFDSNYAYSKQFHQLCGSGGAIYVRGTSNLEVSNSTFKDNYAENNGGAILLETTSTVKIRDGSVFKNNYVAEGLQVVTGYHNNVGGGAISIGGADYLLINESVFESNRGLRDASNRVGSHGGAVAIMGSSGTVDIINSKFKDNYVESYQGRNTGNDNKNSFLGNGGAISIYGSLNSLNVNGSQFINNNATITCEVTSYYYNHGAGGAIYVCDPQKGKVEVKIFNSTFDNNNGLRLGAGSCSGSRGGAIDICYVSTVDISLCNFTRNSVGYGGGAIAFNVSDVSISDCLFENNSVKGFGGAIYHESGSINITATDFTGHYASIHGGVFYGNHVICEIENASVANNSAVDNGGAFCLNGNKLTANNITFLNNFVVKGRGGTIYLNAIGFIYNSTFENTSAMYGGAIAIINGNDGSIYKNLTFINTSAVWGNAIYCNVYVSNLTFDNLTFRYNHNILGSLTPAYGSTVSFGYGASAIMFKNSVFKDIDANETLGAAISFAGNTNNYLNSVNNTIINVTFRNITADSGVVYFRDNCKNNTLKNLTFTENKANADIYIGNYAGNFTLEDINFINNSVKYRGHASTIALHIGADTKNIMVKNVNFTDNWGECEERDSSVVLIGNSAYNVTIINASFKGSHSLNDNYPIYEIKSSATGIAISNSTFLNNKEDEIAGLFIVHCYSYANITNSNFTNYRTRSTGAAVSVSNQNSGNGIFYFENVNFINNTASEAGAMYYHLGSNLTILNSQFINNTATNRGGAFASFGEGTRNVLFYNTTFEDNHAVNGYGGAVYFSTRANTNTFKNLTFTRNYVSNGSGGAFYLGSQVYNISFENIDFINNSARNASFTNKDKYFAGGGGAIFIASSYGKIDYKSLNFTNNYADFVGGAVYQYGGNATLTGCEFTNNSAVMGGAIFLGNITARANISDSIFLLNKANSTVRLEYNTSNSKVIAHLTYNNNFINAIYALSDNVSFTNVTYFQFDENGGKVTNSDVETPQKDYFQYHNVTLVFYNGDEIIQNVTKMTGEGNKAIFDFIAFDRLGRVAAICEANDYVRYSYDDGIYSEGDFNILQNLINAKEDGATLVLGRNYTYTIGFDSMTEGIHVARNLTIDGNGNVIDALGKSRIFYLFSGYLKFVNITFKNAFFEGNGGAVYGTGVDNISIRDCRFENCTALNGSAVYLSGENSQILSSEFIHNGYKANSSGGEFAIGWDEAGNSTPIHTGSGGGGGDIIIKIRSVPATGLLGGGGLIVDPIIPLPVTEDKKASEFIIYTQYGGAVYLNGSNASIRDSNFTLNGAQHGGAVYLNATDSIINSTIFLQNEAGAGGALLSQARNMTVENSSFIENSALNRLVFGEGPDEEFLMNTNYLNNKSEYGGGAVHVSGSNSRIQKSRFYLNLAMDSLGGAVFWLGDDGKILDCNFTFNAAMLGAAVVWDCDAENALINNSVFDILIGMDDLPEFVLGSNPNSSQDEDMRMIFADGEIANFADNAGIVVMDGLNGEVSYSTFNRNEANGYNAGILWFGDEGTLAYSRFSANAASLGDRFVYGSSVFWFGNDGNMSYSNFTNHNNDNFIKSVPVVWYGDYEKSFDLESLAVNESYEYKYGKRGIADGCIFDSNTGIYSSSIAWLGPDGTLSNSKFYNNTAKDTANAIWIGTNGTMTGLTFRDNSAHFGSVCISGYNITLEDSDFERNVGLVSTVAATSFIEWVGDEDYMAFLGRINHKFYMDNCTFTENYGAESIVFINMLDAVINGTEFYKNSALMSNVITLANGTSIINSTFESNSAEIGIVVVGDYGADQYNASLRDSRFISNSVELGGAVTWFGTDGVIDNSNFTQNQHKVFDAVTLAEKLLKFDYEIANDLEGQLNTPLNIWQDNNLLDHAGAAVCWFGSNGTLSDSKFEKNNGESDYNHTSVRNIEAVQYYGGPDLDDLYAYFDFNTILYSGEFKSSYYDWWGNLIEEEGYVFVIATVENSSGNDESYGGAVYWTGENGKINAGTFSNNTAFIAGAVFWAGNDGQINASTFTNNSAFHVGALYTEKPANITGCNFTANRASQYAGAVLLSGEGSNLTQSKFMNNAASLGGALYNVGANTISDSEFRYNKADNGSALYVMGDGFSIKSSTFLDNQALSSNLTGSFNVTGNDVSVSATFKGNDNLINAIYTESPVEMNDVTYWGAEGVKTTDGSEEISDLEAGQNITLGLYDDDGNLVSQMKGVTDINGNVNITIPGVRNGRYTAVLSHREDSYYTEIMENGEVKVYVTPVDIDVEDIFYRQNATANITLESDVTGNITVQIDGENFTQIDMSGKNGFVSLDNISALNAGIHYITVIYSGDENYTNCSNTVRFFVKQINSTVIISAENGNYSDDIPVSVVVGPNDDESGKVILTIENEYGFILNITDSLELEAVINTLDVGDYNITAYYTGDVNYLPSTNTTNFTVRPVNLIADATALNVTVRQNTTFTLNVSDFNGRVNITVDGITKLVNITGTTDVIFDRLASGEKTAYVTFFADSRYKNLTVPVTFKVSEIPQSFVNVSAQNITEGAIAEITVRVPDVQTGNVTITVNNLTYIKEIVNGTVKLNVTGLAPGQYPVNVTYLGNDIYDSVSNSTEFNVSAKTTPVINIEAVEVIEVDGRFILNVTVTPELDLNVTINGGEIELIDGHYEFTADRIGSFTVVATTEENAQYNAGYNETTFTVIRHNASIADVSATPSVTVGQNTTIVVTMTDNNVTNGKIMIEVNGMNYTVDIIDKVAKLNVTLPVGTYNATAYFMGDDKYNSDNKTSSNFAVVEKNVTGINITGIKVVEVDDVLVIHVETNSTENMVVRVNGKTADLDSNGNFTADTTAAGTYIVTVDVQEGEFWTKAFKNETYTVVKHNAAIESVNVTESVTIGDNAEINVTLNVESGKLLIEINNMNYTVDINDFNATLSLVLPVGEYPVKVYYLGDDKYYGTENLSAGVINVADKYACEIVISVDKVWVVDDTVVFEVTTNSTADLTVKVNGEDANAMGDGKYNITADAVGVYTITAETDENDYYHAGSNSTTFTVIKHNSTVEIAPIDTHYVDEAFTITVESNATVNVTINGKAYEVVDGTVNVDGLAAGEYTVVATVYENAKYNGNITNATFSIVKYDAVISSVNVTESVTLGDNAVVNVSMANVSSGKLLIEINGMNYTVDINDFNATLSLVLPVGEYPVKVYYLGDDKYYGTENLSAGTIYVADKYACEIAISVDKVWVVDDVVVFEVTTNSTADLTVKVNGEDANAMGNGMYNITADAVGVYTITAETDGNDYYHAGSQSETFTVVKHNSTVEIAPINTHYVDEAFTITVESNATVNVTINGKAYEVIGGTVNVGGLAAGEYTIVATVYENAKYNGNITNATFSIVKYDAVISSVNVTENVALGDNAEINVTLNVESGKLLIEINGMNYTVDINGYNAELSLALPVGEYPVKVYYLGDDKYYGTENLSAGTINVADKYACEIVISVDKVWVVDDTVIFEVTTNSTADLTVKVNGEDANAMGNGMYNITADAAGVYTITAETDENDYYHAGSQSETFTVVKHNSTVEIAPINTHYIGETFIITVESNATVNVTINGKAYEVVDGKVTVSGLDAGEYTVNAIVFENDKYNGNAANETFNVTKYASFVIVEADSITAGEIAVIKVTAPDDAEAMVILNIGGINYEVDIVNGSGELKLSGLDQGNYSIAALYLENDKYLLEINCTLFNVSKVDGNASLDVEDSTVGEHAVITVTVPEDANGEVTVTVGNITKTVPVTGGENQIVIDRLPEGEHNVTAVYNGGDKYNPQTLNGTINVTPAKPDDPINHEINVTIENVTSDSAVAIIEVADNMNGEVNITVDGKTFTGTVENGTAIVPLENLTPGKHDVSVIFEGDDNTVTTAQTTVDIPKEESGVNVTVDVDGDKATVTVDVPEDATGPVLIDVDGKGYYAPVEDGKAVLNITDLAPGDHTVKATYPGDDKYSSASDEDNFTVPKTSHEVNITADANTVEVDVADDINGTVTVSVDGKNYTAPVVNGKAVVPIDELAPGAHEIEAVVKGDDNTTSAAKATVDIPKEDAPLDIDVNGTVITVELPEDATGVVLIDVDGKGYYAPAENGKATVSVDKLDGENHTVTAEYLGDDKYNPSNATKDFNTTRSIATVIVVERKFTRVANDWDAGERGAFFYGVLMDTDGNLLANKKVQIAVNGPIYNVTTDEEGRAGLQVNLQNANTYTYALFFAGDEKYNASHIASTKLTVVKKTTSISASAKSFKASAKTKTVSVTLKTSKNPYNGKTYLSAGKKITLTVAGKTYTAKTDAKGVAKFNVKITKKGSYTAKLSFAGDKTYESSGKSVKITVK